MMNELVNGRGDAQEELEGFRNGAAIQCDPIGGHARPNLQDARE